MYGDTACMQLLRPDSLQWCMRMCGASRLAGKTRSARSTAHTVPHRVWGLAASSTARIVGSSLYTTPVMVLLRNRSIWT